jgi:hypothetical protein
MQTGQGSRIYHPLLGSIFEAVGFSFCLLGSAALFYVLLLARIPERRDRKGAAVLVTLPPAILATAFLVIGRRLKHKPGDTILEEDHRAPVLYLRSFAFDGPLSKGNWEGSIASLLGGSVGPPVCIGRPGERLPRSGFHRIYVPNDAWQERVKELIRQARCVVFVQGATDGLAWELETIVELIDPERLLLLIPMHRYDQLRKLAETRLPLPLPEVGDFYCGLPYRYDDIAAILFYENWQPVPLPVKCRGKVGWLERQRWVNWVASRNVPMDVESTLQPFVERLTDHLPRFTVTGEKAVSD